MIRATYTRSLILGILGVAAGLMAIYWGVKGFIDAPSLSTAATFLMVLAWGCLGVIHILRSLARIEVTQAGLRKLGVFGWQLGWNEIESMQLTDNELVIKPTHAASKNQSVNVEVGWGCWFAPGKHPLGSIVLPKPELDDAARAALSPHLGSAR